MMIKKNIFILFSFTFLLSEDDAYKNTSFYDANHKWYIGNNIRSLSSKLSISTLYFGNANKGWELGLGLNYDNQLKNDRGSTSYDYDSFSTTWNTSEIDNREYVKDDFDNLSIVIGLSKRFINFDNQKSRGFIRLSCFAGNSSQNYETEYYDIDFPDRRSYSTRVKNTDELSLSIGYEFEYFLNENLTFNFGSSILTSYLRNSDEIYRRFDNSDGDIQINYDTKVNESISIDLYGFSYGFKYYF